MPAPRLAATILLAAGTFAQAASAAAPQPRHFAFGDAPVAARSAAVIAVTPDMAYTAAHGYGFEPGAAPGGGKPFYFSVDLPEGSYKVTVRLGGAAAASTTVKAELRRLMLENVQTAPGQSQVKTFAVNIRTPPSPQQTMSPPAKSS